MSWTQFKPLTGSHAGFFNPIPGWPNGLRKSSVTYDVVRDGMPCAIAIIVKQRGQSACTHGDGSAAYCTFNGVHMGTVLLHIVHIMYFP